MDRRSLHDALCVIQCLVTKKFLIGGGGALKSNLSRRLGAWAKVLHGMESYCVRSFMEALEVIPYTLAENAEFEPNSYRGESRTDMQCGEINLGINVRKGGLQISWRKMWFSPLLVSTQALSHWQQSRVRMILED
ncbi:hypothetical protein IFM89_039372 [Coptis chinensis]|uniref:Uncharacterized protein n=1 Tax=Coptis chinensis TaxID=261450 RepID=A0A835HSU1_9MAGN|nr:hypothetical protein IFM89_039372 [Coptis chinensis]